MALKLREDKNADGIDDKKQEKALLAANNDRWKNRRRMAWTALFSIIVVTYMTLFKVDVERLAVLKEVITWFYFVMGSIVGSFVGFTSWAEVMENKK